MNEIVKKALNDKVPGLDLGASLVSRRFWASLGFEVVKEDFVPIKNNQKLHFYRMVKSLSIGK